uniref:Heat shock protein 70 n=1 Tax=Proboscia sp. TaxID=1923967 RepID=A0A2U9NM65_9STRA|nr:heat shock protein 70 [Proboscia sp.]
MESQKKYGKVVGIDLGTTNSVIAIIEGGRPKVIVNQEGLRLTPSVVAFTKEEGFEVGQIAKRQAVLNPENTFFSVKRFIGATNITAKELDIYPYKVTYNEASGIEIYSPEREQTFSPQQISGWVLRKLIEEATLYLEQKVTQAVITVPAYFTDSQRQATIDAGKIAGIEVLRIINEPTAASLAYGLTQKENSKVLIFDLGGGTFDVSIMEVGEGISEVLATSGDTSLGGDDFTKVITNWLVSGFENEEGINLEKDQNIQALQRIIEASEKAKLQLSSVETTKIYLPFITTDKNGPKHIDKVLTREEFERLSEALIIKCETPIKTALEDANLTTEEIDKIILVGGSTRIPAIQDLIRTLLKKEPNKSVDPDEVVALGAAIQAGILTGEVKDILLLDVTPLSLGVETFGNVFTRIITRNTAIPVRKSETFSTAYENQNDAEIHVLQGESEMAKDNKSLGRFYLGGIPNSQKGVPEIDITFDLNVDGILSVTAKERETGSEQSIQIQGTSSLEQEEIEKMLEDAAKSKETSTGIFTNDEDRENVEKLWNEVRQEMTRFRQKGYNFTNLSLVRIKKRKGAPVTTRLINTHIKEACQRFTKYYSAKRNNSKVIKWPKDKLS